MVVSGAADDVYVFNAWKKSRRLTCAETYHKAELILHPGITSYFSTCVLHQIITIEQTIDIFNTLAITNFHACWLFIIEADCNQHILNFYIHSDNYLNEYNNSSYAALLRGRQKFWERGAGNSTLGAARKRMMWEVGTLTCNSNDKNFVWNSVIKQSVTSNLISIIRSYNKFKVAVKVWILK